jgi:hypothetical protein
MKTPNEPPGVADMAALLQDLRPLPLSGQAWPDWVRILAWILLAVLGMEALMIVISMPPGKTNPLMAAGGTVCFVLLAVVAWFMQVSVTTIDAHGLRQTWFSRREVRWEEIHSARYVPLLFSKRLMVFTRSGRPVIFQGGTRELLTAFARIAVTFNAKP